MSLQKRKALRVPKILRAAEGQECLAEFPGCTGTSADVAARHFNEPFAGKATSMKADDVAIFFGCQACENVYSGLVKDKRIVDAFNDDKYWYLCRAAYRTIRRLFDLGVIK